MKKIENNKYNVIYHGIVLPIVTLILMCVPPVIGGIYFVNVSYDIKVISDVLNKIIFGICIVIILLVAILIIIGILRNLSFENKP